MELNSFSIRLFHIHRRRKEKHERERARKGIPLKRLYILEEIKKKPKERRKTKDYHFSISLLIKKVLPFFSIIFIIINL